MSKEQTKDLLEFLKPFDHNTVDLVMWLRDLAWDLCPQANELIYESYIKKLVGEAYANSLSKVKDPKQFKQGLTIVKSISAKKRPKKGQARS